MSIPFFNFLEDFFNPLPHPRDRAGSSSPRTRRSSGTASGTRPSDQDRKGKSRKPLFFSSPLGNYIITLDYPFVKSFFVGGGRFLCRLLLKPSNHFTAFVTELNLDKSAILRTFAVKIAERMDKFRKLFFIHHVSHKVFSYIGEHI